MKTTFKDTPGYIYRVFSQDKIRMYDRIKLHYIRFLLLCYNRYKWSNWKFLYGIMINRDEAIRVFGSIKSK